MVSASSRSRGLPTSVPSISITVSLPSTKSSGCQRAMGERFVERELFRLLTRRKVGRRDFLGCRRDDLERDAEQGQQFAAARGGGSQDDGHGCWRRITPVWR